MTLATATFIPEETQKYEVEHTWQGKRYEGTLHLPGPRRTEAEVKEVAAEFFKSFEENRNALWERGIQPGKNIEIACSKEGYTVSISGKSRSSAVEIKAPTNKILGIREEAPPVTPRGAAPRPNIPQAAGQDIQRHTKQFGNTIVADGLRKITDQKGTLVNFTNQYLDERTEIFEAAHVEEDIKALRQQRSNCIWNKEGAFNPGEFRTTGKGKLLHASKIIHAVLDRKNVEKLVINILDACKGDQRIIFSLPDSVSYAQMWKILTTYAKDHQHDILRFDLIALALTQEQYNQIYPFQIERELKIIGHTTFRVVKNPRAPMGTMLNRETQIIDQVRKILGRGGLEAKFCLPDDASLEELQRFEKGMNAIIREPNLRQTSIVIGLTPRQSGCLTS